MKAAASIVEIHHPLASGKHLLKMCYQILMNMKKSRQPVLSFEALRTIGRIVRAIKERIELRSREPTK